MTSPIVFIYQQQNYVFAIVQTIFKSFIAPKLTNNFGLLIVNLFLVMQLNSFKIESVHHRG